MPAVNWTDAARVQMLLIIIQLGHPPKWDKVAELLNNGCTGEAARQQYKLLRTKAKKEFGEITVDGGDVEDKPKTPAKGRGKKTDAGSAAKSTGKRNMSKISESVAEDDEESPIKKTKIEHVKVEDESNEDLL